MRNDAGELDWTKLDYVATEKTKTFRYSQSMFGTFDFNAEPDQSTTVSQRQRVQRRRGPLGVEKKPISITQTANAKGGKKLEVIFKELEKVNRIS